MAYYPQNTGSHTRHVRYIFYLFTLLLVPMAFFLCSSINDVGSLFCVIFTVLSCYGSLVAYILNTDKIASQEKIAEKRIEQETAERFDVAFFRLLYRYHNAVHDLQYTDNEESGKMKEYVGRQVLNYLAEHNRVCEKDDIQFRNIACTCNLETCLTHLFAICKLIKAASISAENRAGYMMLMKKELTDEEKYVCGKYRYIIYKLWDKTDIESNVIDEVIEYVPFNSSPSDASDKDSVKSQDKSGGVSGWVGRLLKKCCGKNAGESAASLAGKKSKSDAQEEKTKDGASIMEKCTAFIVIAVAVLLAGLVCALSYPDEEYVKISASKGKVSVQTEYRIKSSEPEWRSWGRRLPNVMVEKMTELLNDIMAPQGHSHGCGHH